MTNVTRRSFLEMALAIGATGGNLSPSAARVRAAHRPTHLNSFKRNLTSMKASKLIPTLMVHGHLMVHRLDSCCTPADTCVAQLRRYQLATR